MISRQSNESVLTDTSVQCWPIARLVPYASNPRKNDAAVDRMAASIQEFGFKIPVLARSSGEVVRRIATDLNTRGWRTRKGSAWRLESVARVTNSNTERLLN